MMNDDDEEFRGKVIFLPTLVVGVSKSRAGTRGHLMPPPTELAFFLRFSAFCCCTGPCMGILGLSNSVESDVIYVTF